MIKEFGNLSEDREIDKLRLDEENAIQPSKYGYYLDALAQAKTELDRAKQNYEATVSARSLYYRRNPPTDIKATEAVYTDLVNTDTQVLEAKDALIRAQEAVNVLYASVASIEDVRKSIDNLVKLQLSSYYNSQGMDNARDKLNQ